MQNYFTLNSFSQKISRLAASLFLAVTVGLLAGCSGGSDTRTTSATGTATGGTGGTGTTTTAPTAATIQLLASSPQIASSGATTVDLTAIVLSASKQVVSGRTVTFSTGSDPTAFVNNISGSGISDANGVVTGKLNLGSNKTNRTITLTATADSASATNTVDVTGTTVTFSGGTSVASGNQISLIISVKDSAGTAMSGLAVTVVSKFGNTVALSAASTNSSGEITATITADSPTAIAAKGDDIKATAANVSSTQSLTISSSKFDLKASNPLPACNPATATGINASPPEIPLTGDVCSTPTVTVTWTDAVTAPVGPVTFSTSRGTISGGNVTANSSSLGAGGTASVQVSSATAGPAIVSAAGPGGTPSTSINVVFVATSAETASVQAVPGTIQVKTGAPSQTNHTSKISVLVRDVANNLVKNAGVNFTVTTDPSGGSLNSARAVTDVNGSAEVTYTAGSASSPSNGVIIQATVTDINGVVIPPVTNTTKLTVAGQSLLVRLGTDNLVGGTAPINTKTYVAIVTDSAGNAVVGNTVRFALRPGRYWKGHYDWDPVAKQWVQTVTSPLCPNEDLNFNGILDSIPVVAANEDLNASAALEPGNVATVTATSVTDAAGVATAVITYPKDHSNWVEQQLEARTGVVGNDPPALVTFTLPGLAKDYLEETVPPPGRISPYGYGNPAAVPPNNHCSNLL